ncbi:MAG: DUF2752 domain-containing protein [Planctomycetes bacterium]|nr:DUF2752 domain-containing protein [Planctomycetota bacterium]
MLLAVAAWLKPDPRGFGTHEQLGLLPCGFLRATGLPCPTCGMTTSFACMVRGRFPESAAAQPFGAFLCLMVAASTVGSLRALAWGYPFQARLAAVRWLYIGPGLGVFFFLSWAYGCARALGKL